MLIRKMFDNSGYPSPFTNSIIGNEDKYMIPPNFFKIAKESILMEFPYCPQNELVDKAKKKIILLFPEMQVTRKIFTRKAVNLFF